MANYVSIISSPIAVAALGLAVWVAFNAAPTEVTLADSQLYQIANIVVSRLQPQFQDLRFSDAEEAQRVVYSAAGEETSSVLGDCKRKGHGRGL
jgi:hypothetical protein